MEIYENKGLLHNFKEVNYFTYYNANNNLEIVEIKEEYKEIKQSNLNTCVFKN